MAYFQFFIPLYFRIFKFSKNSWIVPFECHQISQSIGWSVLSSISNLMKKNATVTDNQIWILQHHRGRFDKGLLKSSIESNINLDKLVWWMRSSRCYWDDATPQAHIFQFLLFRAGCLQKLVVNCIIREHYHPFRSRTSGIQLGNI